MLDLEFAELSDLGSVRESNEDCLGHFAPATPEQARRQGWLFALADGVGGQSQGEVASRAAVESLLAGFKDAPAGEPLSSLLPRLVQEANTRVLEASHATAAGGSDMATTLVACALRYDRAAVVHVGDSRCYLVRRGQARALTRDHTVAAEQARLGLLADEEASNASTRHMLSRSLGGGLFVSVELTDHQIVPDDALVLCSDGLHGAVSDTEIGRIVSHSAHLSAAAKSLVALANQRDGSDNISVQLVRVRGVERVGMYRGRPYKLH
jgi:serine/threonine protein phosphatase PrpC